MKKSMLNSFDPERRQCLYLYLFHVGYVNQREREREETTDANHVACGKKRRKKEMVS